MLEGRTKAFGYCVNVMARQFVLLVLVVNCSFHHFTVEMTIVDVFELFDFTVEHKKSACDSLVGFMKLELQTNSIYFDQQQRKGAGIFLGL